MDRSALARFTVDEDPEVIPGTQIWIDGDGRVWHDLHGVHTNMFARGVEKEWREWRSDFTFYLQRLNVPTERYHLNGQDRSRVWNIADSFAVLSVLWHAAEISHTLAWVSACFDLLMALQGRIIRSLARPNGSCISAELHAMERVSVRMVNDREVHFPVREGQLEGWGAWYSSLSKSTRRAWSTYWSRMPECASFSISDDVQRVSTILHFAVFFRRVRIGVKGKISVATQRVLHALQRGLVEFLAHGLDYYLKHVYLSLRPGRKPPPARISPKKKKGDDDQLHTCVSAVERTCVSAVQRPRKYVVVDPEAMWDMMEDSRVSGASLAQVTVVRRSSAHAGCGERVTSDVLSCMNGLYAERMRMAFTGASHLCIVADPATHSKKETMVGLCWSWEEGVAAYGAIQYIPQTREVLPTEQEMPEHIEILWRERRLERVAAFRQLQALSNIIRQTGCWGGIDDFRLGDDYDIDAVEDGEVRVVQEGVALRVRRDSGTARRVLPEAALAPAQSNNALAPAQSNKLLVVCLDQGSVGAAGIVFAQEHMRAMIFAHWDKFHRFMETSWAG